jgi:hypothetical protein
LPLSAMTFVATVGVVETSPIVRVPVNGGLRLGYGLNLLGGRSDREVRCECNQYSSDKLQSPDTDPPAAALISRIRLVVANHFLLVTRPIEATSVA